MTKGYDPLFSVELKSKRTKNSKTFLNLDSSLTTIFYADGEAVRKNATYYSIASHDGDVRSSNGSTGDDTSTGYAEMRLGLSAGKYYRVFMSFDTSGIPDDAIIDSAYLRVRCRFAEPEHTVIQVDYSLYGALDNSDFQRAPEASNIASITGIATSKAWKNSGNFTNVNKTGYSQYRLRKGQGEWDGEGWVDAAESDYDPELHVTYHIPIPAAPTNCVASYVATNNTKCTWTDNSDNETGFRLEVDIDDAGWAFWKNVGENVEDSGNHPTGANKKIRFRVRAYNDAGDSDWATSGYVYTIPTIPSDLAASWLVQYETVRLTYTKNQAYGNIDVYSQVDGDGFAHLAYDDASPYDDETPTGEDYKYEYKVRARSPQNDDSSYTYSAFTDIVIAYSTVTLSESIGLLESLPVIDRQLTLEEAIALKDVSVVPACADQVLETAIALAPQFPANKQTIVRVAATAEFLAEQAKRSNQPAKRIWLYIDSILYDITDRFQSMGPIDREMTYKPGETNRITLSDQTLVMSNADKYFSDLNPVSPFYDRDYAGADTVKIFAGFIIPSTGYAEVLQKADMKLLYIELETKTGIARLGCEDSFRDLFDKYVGMPTSEGASAPLIYIDKTFKFIMDDLLQTHAGIAEADCDIEDVDLTFDSVTWEKKTISACIQQISEVARGSTVLLGDGTVKFRKFTSESTSIDLVLRPSQAYAALKYRGQDFHWKINKVVVIGDEAYAEAEISGEPGRTLKIENTEIESSDPVAIAVAMDYLGRFAVRPAYVEIRGEYLPSLELGDVLEIHEPSSMMNPEILAVRKLALDIAGFKSAIWATPLSAGGGSKIWTSKAELEDGTLVNVLVPEGLNRLELKRKQLLGTATYIFDVGSDKTANWVFFNSSSEDANIIYRNDFRDGEIGDWTPRYGTWSASDYYLKGTSQSEWFDNLAFLDISELTDFDVLMKIYKTNTDNIFHFFLRYTGYKGNSYGWELTKDYCEYFRVSGVTVPEDEDAGKISHSPGTWYWCKVSIYTSGGNVTIKIKLWGLGEGEPDWQRSHTFSGEWVSSGKLALGRYKLVAGEVRYDNIVLSHYEGVPDPPGTTVSFKFWSSDNGDDWTGPHTAIADVADSRYFKVEVKLERESLASAMPVLNDMTVGYFLKGS